ncbi:MAG: dihydrolipoyl dehydrogenase [Rhodothalassiaceae bacterium]
MADNAFDLIVIGAGPGGYVAAIRAAQLGLRTAVIEREHLGGICLNWGCIPTKALLRSAEIKHYLDHAGDYGLSAGAVSFDLERIVKRSRQVAGQLNAGVKTLLRKNKVTTIMGTARLDGPGRVTVSDAAGKSRTLAAKNIIIATGARARELPHLKADGKHIWTYRQAMVPDSLPKRLLVVGSGAIGVEFASFYRDLGAEVIIVEVLDRILPVEDAEISAFAQKQFEKQGLRILTSASVDKLESRSDGVRATVKTKAGKTETIDVDRVILAIGITGNVEDLGLEEAGVRIEKGHVVVDAWGRTGVDGLWAIGDVAGPPWLAHKASHEGVIAVEKIAGIKGLHPLDVQRIPGCTYSRPQVASVGLSEEKAKAAGHKLRVGRFPFIGNGKAIALGEPEGFVKTIFDAETGALLGAHMIGAEVTELIQGYAVAMTLETTEAELMHTVFPHPTLSEMMHESVLAAYGRAIHI